MDEWEPFERELFERVIIMIADAYGELPSGSMSEKRQQFHAMMGHSLLDSAVGGDVENAVALTRQMYGEGARQVLVLPKQ